MCLAVPQVSFQMGAQSMVKFVDACGNLPDHEGDVGQEEVPLSSFLVSHPPLHSLEHLVESLGEAICLWVVDRHPDLLDLEQLTDIQH